MNDPIIQPNVPLMAQLVYLGPVLILCLTALLLIAIEVVWKVMGHKRGIAPRLSADIATFGALIALADVWYLWDKVGNPGQVLGVQLFLARGPEAMSAGTGSPAWTAGALVIDHFALFSCAMVAAIVIVTRMMLMPYLRRTGVYRAELYPLILLSAMGMMVLCMSRDLLVMFIAIEIVSLPLYVLCGLDQDRDESRESSLKYFLLGAFASGFLIYGAALVYFAVGHLNYKAIAYYLTTTTEVSSVLLIGMALVGVGMLFKLALVPFHSWVPDVYQGAPTPVTAFMAAGVKLAVFAGAMRIVVETVGPMDNTIWQTALSVFAVLSMVIGNLFALHQMSAKRLLAYSAITHSGYLAVGLAAGSIASPSLLVYLAGYLLASMGAFAIISYLAPANQDDIYLDEMHELSKRAPGSAISLTILLLSMAGFPMTIGFIGKLMVFTDAWRAGLYGLVILAVLNSVVAVYYYFRFILAMYMQPKAPGAVELKLERASQSYVVSGVLTVGLTLLLGVLPSVLTQFIQHCKLGF